MKNKHREIQAGDICGSVEVLKIESCNVRSETRYCVKHSCCGKTEWITHKPLLARIRGTRGKKGMCRSCAAKHLVKHRGPGHLAKKQIFIPGWGLTLGKFRHYA